MAVIVGLISVSALLIRSEQLRKSAELANSRSNAKAAQLTEAIERLFIVAAESPTIRLEESSALREKLLQEASAMYEQIAADEPKNESLQVERSRSIFRIAKLYSLLGNTNRSLELAKEC